MVQSQEDDLFQGGLWPHHAAHGPQAEAEDAGHGRGGKRREAQGVGGDFRPGDGAVVSELLL